MYAHKLGACARVRISVRAHTCACPRTCPRCFLTSARAGGRDVCAHLRCPHPAQHGTANTGEPRVRPTNGRHPPHPHSVEQFIRTQYVDHPTCDYARVRVCVRASHSATFKIMMLINKTYGVCCASACEERPGSRLMLSRAELPPLTISRKR